MARRFISPSTCRAPGSRWVDLHFSQGDGEITFCGAIEMAGWLHLKVDVIKDGMSKYGIKSPIFKPSPIKPNYTDYLIFDGISVDEHGQQHYLDVGVAYRQACLAAIEYLKKFGYSGEQAYSILGTAPVQGHISGVVDVPNACATLWIPTEIFDFDINPGDGRTDEVPRRQRHAADSTRSLRARAMPVYDYQCATCGPFTAFNAMAGLCQTGGVRRVRRRGPTRFQRRACACPDGRESVPARPRRQ